jgi:centrosomal protein CEP89
MASKLPIRKKVEPLFRIVSEMENAKIQDNQIHTKVQQFTSPAIKDEVSPDKRQTRTNKDRPPPVPPHGKKDAKIYFNEKRSRSVEAKNNRKNDDLKRNIRETVKAYISKYHLYKKPNIQLFTFQLQSKDEQIEKLLDKIATLFNYNAQFAHENEKLQKDKLILADSFHAINQKLNEIQTGDCEKCTELEQNYTLTKKQHEKSYNEAHELRNDVKMLKVLVFRLNLQLEYYQDVIRENRDLNPSQIRHQIDAASSATPVLSPTQTIHWGEVKSHVLAPLLNAYEETISEKNDLIQHYHSEMNTFTSRIKILITENEKLQQQMDEMKTSKENWMSEKVRMQAQLDICR